MVDASLDTAALLFQSLTSEKRRAFDTIGRAAYTLARVRNRKSRCRLSLEEVGFLRVDGGLLSCTGHEIQRQGFMQVDFECSRVD